MHRSPGRATEKSRMSVLGVLSSAIALVLTAVCIVLAPGVVLLCGAAAAVFLPLEHLRRRDELRVRRRGSATDLVHFACAGPLTAAGVFVTTATLGTLLSVPLSPARDAVEGQAPWARSLLAVAIVLIGGYWGHRLAHALPVLWRLHALHHAMTELDWLTGVRTHPLDQVWNSSCYAVPLVALGLVGWRGAGVVGTVLLAAGLFGHANIRSGKRVPLLHLFLPSPSWHGWHHALDADAWDTNYSAFPFVDFLFGTAFVPEDGRQPTGYGGPRMPDAGYLAQMVAPFQRNPSI